ncbi:CheR family methyltransferase [Niveibacterium sp. SC-1]|uniref:CheR family methyltransferase n=1 Tax=Niveibacterium sp. SC-1 TaxID=3135646 RepID=UPI00311D44F5
MSLPPGDIVLDAQSFGRLQRFFQEASGIHLGANKHALVAGRLRKRLNHLGLRDFAAYCDLLLEDQDADERRQAVHLLTTHETYFFREAAHFRLLTERVLPTLAAPRIWSAACSTGEETYSLAMTLDDTLGDRKWTLVGSDISDEAVAHSRRGLYRMQRLDAMPPQYLKRYCLRGTGHYAGSLLIDPGLRRRVQFFTHNLLEEPGERSRFDAIFLRNVLIYFDGEQKRRILQRVLSRLEPGGWLFVGHSESLQGLDLPLQSAGKAVYRRTA